MEPFEHLHDPVDPSLSAAALRALPSSTCLPLAARVGLRIMPIMADSLTRLKRQVDVSAGLLQRCEFALRSLLDDQTGRPDDLQSFRSELSRVLHQTEDTRSGPRGVRIPRGASTQLSAELAWSSCALFHSCHVVEHAIQTSSSAPFPENVAPWDHVYLGVFFAMHAEACQRLLRGQRPDGRSHITLATKFDTELAATEPQALRDLPLWPTEQPDWAR